MATPADKAKAQMALYGLAILQSAALRGSQAAADGVKRAVQFLQGVPSVPDLAGQAVRKVGDIMLPPTYPSTKPAPRPAWGPTAPSKPDTMRVQPSQPFLPEQLRRKHELNRNTDLAHPVIRRQSRRSGIAVPRRLRPRRHK
jgi:hypothetical protein